MFNNVILLTCSCRGLPFAIGQFCPHIFILLINFLDLYFLRPLETKTCIYTDFQCLNIQASLRWTKKKYHYLPFSLSCANTNNTEQCFDISFWHGTKTIPGGVSVHTLKNGDFGAISVTERTYAARISKVVDCKQSVFSSKSVKKSVKCGVRVLRREPSLPQSRSLFSASFQTFCLTAGAYLNRQKYGLFCSLLKWRVTYLFTLYQTAFRVGNT